MIAVTGAGGFIGSVLVGYLNTLGIDDIVIFDDLPYDSQFKNLVGKKFISLHSTDEIFENAGDLSGVVHLGANANTLEKDWSSLYKTNVLSTRTWNEFCKQNNIPFVFASSAAVYGNGNGPMNHYAFSKMISENELNGVILRLFNVYGPNEYHKARMASTVYHWFRQINETGKIKIFENSDKYLRDFIFVEDVAKIIVHFLTKSYVPGIYDIGTGNPASFETVADTLIDLVGHGHKEYIVMPEDLKTQYQTNTCASIESLKSADFDVSTLLPAKQGIARYFSYLKADYSYY
jgi:ADP-L-glycero-D-manno-heptose 6-epimerase